jgi:hypothetical protein
VRIPAVPDCLRLPVEHEWTGGPAGPALSGQLGVAACSEGLEVAARFPLRPGARIPDAAPGARVANLWTYDVAECFIVGSDGQYLEVELGAGGHFLVLCFDAPRRQSDACESLELAVEWRVSSGAWSSRVVLPWRLVPEVPQRLNAFAIFGEHFLVHSALPGSTPDFHQPAHYPAVTLSPAAAAASTSARAS